jgi:2-dehydro-3-deoxy-D-gluconate 5-dehydrogenase
MADEVFRLDGRVALVTGAARGIGAAIAVGLAQAGADVALLDVLDCDETASRVSATGRTHAIRCDLQSLGGSHAGEIVAEVRGALGRLDLLINNAGVIHREPALDHAEEAWERVLRIDLSSAFYLSRAFARPLVEAGRGGKVVNVCSMLSFQGGKHVPSYAAAKSGLAGLTRALANEWAPVGINVNGVAPGYLETEVTAGIRSDSERSAAILSRIPAGRWGRPEDVAGAVVFLCSEAAAYVHGVILPVDGGWLAW